MHPIALASLALLLSPAFHRPAAAQALEGEDANIARSEAFLSHHPDLKFRKRGLEVYYAGRPAQAVQSFRFAARYADKPSMAMLAEMYWTGTGVARDPSLAYAWADLAAERGYPDLVRKREAYWSQLDRAARERALEVGLPLLREFGDAAARPRMERQLAIARRDITGSRVGNVGAVRIRFPSTNGAGGHEIDGARFYDAKFYQPDEYYAWQARTWNQRPGAHGSVEIGDLQADEGDRD